MIPYNTIRYDMIYVFLSWTSLSLRRFSQLCYVRLESKGTFRFQYGKARSTSEASFPAHQTS